VQGGSGALAAGVRRVDLSQVAEVDSAAVALLLEWVKQTGSPFVIEGAPAPLYKLAQLYCVHTMLPFAAAPAADPVRTV